MALRVIGVTAVKQILLVEDNDELRELLGLLLTGRGYTVITARNGHEAFDWLQRNPPPGVILLDLNMPAMNGWEFERHRRSIPALLSIPVLVLSAWKEDPRSRYLSTAAFISKPFDPAELMALVDRLYFPQ